MIFSYIFPGFQRFYMVCYIYISKFPSVLYVSCYIYFQVSNLSICLGVAKKAIRSKKKAVLSMVSPKINRSIYAIGSMYAIYGNIYHTIPPMLAYIAAPWILWVCSHRSFPLVPTTSRRWKLYETLRQVQRIHVLPQFLLLLKAFHFIIVPNQPTAEVQLLLSALRWMDQKLDPCKNRC